MFTSSDAADLCSGIEKNKHKTYDGFRAIGIPILMLIVTVYIVFLVLLLTKSVAVQWTRLGLVHTVVLATSVLQFILSFFLLFSAAWGFSMANEFVSLVVLLATTMKNDTLTRYAFGALVLLNFSFVFGIPGLSSGLLFYVRDQCRSWFRSYCHSMCVEGWVTTTEFFAVVIMTTQFANAFTFFTFLIERDYDSAGLSSLFPGNRTLGSMGGGQYESIGGGTITPANTSNLDPGTPSGSGGYQSGGSPIAVSVADSKTVG